eukprot:5774930-Pyramimonas_sp.AAC.1
MHQGRPGGREVIRASRFGSDSSSSFSPLGGGARARSYLHFALRAVRSAKLGALDAHDDHAFSEHIQSR